MGLSCGSKVYKAKQCQQVLDRHPFLQSRVSAGTALPVPFAETSPTNVRKRKSAELRKHTQKLKAEAAAEEEAAKADQESLLADLLQNPEAVKELSYAELYSMMGVACLEVSKELNSKDRNDPETMQRVILLQKFVQECSKECIYEEQEEAEKEALWPALEP